MPSGEVDTGYLLSELFRADKYALGTKYVEVGEHHVDGYALERPLGRKVYVPRVLSFDGSGKMEMLRVTGGWYEVLSFNESPNQWGIPEPCEKAAKRMENALTESVDLDVLIVPGMAYDRPGRRCGHGGGFYDR